MLDVGKELAMVVGKAIAESMAAAARLGVPRAYVIRCAEVSYDLGAGTIGEDEAQRRIAESAAENGIKG